MNYDNELDTDKLKLLKIIQIGIGISPTPIQVQGYFFKLSLPTSLDVLLFVMESERNINWKLSIAGFPNGCFVFYVFENNDTGQALKKTGNCLTENFVFDIANILKSFWMKHAAFL